MRCIMLTGSRVSLEMSVGPLTNGKDLVTLSDRYLRSGLGIQKSFSLEFWYNQSISKSTYE